jgi:hypothetical protein
MAPSAMRIESFTRSLKSWIFKAVVLVSEIAPYTCAISASAP